MKLDNLTEKNITIILTKIINKINGNKIDQSNISEIVTSNKIDGKKLQEIIQTDTDNFNELKIIFNELDIFSNKWKKIDEFLKFWKSIKFEDIDDKYKHQTLRDKNKLQDILKELKKEQKNTNNSKSNASQNVFSSSSLNSPSYEDDEQSEDDKESNEQQIEIKPQENKIPFIELSHDKDPYPSYIYKSVK